MTTFDLIIILLFLTNVLYHTNAKVQIVCKVLLFGWRILYTNKSSGARMESGLRYIQIELFIVSSREMSSFRDRDTGRQFAASCQSASRKRTLSL